MLQRVYLQVQKSGVFHQSIIATDDERIADHGKSFGAKVLMTSAAHRSGTDRCGEVLSLLQEQFDVIVNVQGDEPFIQPEQLHYILTAFTDPETGIATLAKKTSDLAEINNPNIVKVVCDIRGYALYFSRAPIPFARQPHDAYLKHIGLYAFRPAILRSLVQLPGGILEAAESLEQLRWLAHGYRIRVLETDLETLGIDTPEDIKKIHEIL